ncbi:histone deacetylase family protein [Afifella marina]|uniref:Acetoin utilization deacetylase AcuC n=1 Tax=Afifella marina DSM 2698 TaxID=1120955 RepID=A0A1G5MBY1_AFIMA|nr:histone deacetylase family protein [Afifella marina]MBK1622745.1 acetoin utilization protein [Afifella marina DSM 2698]MBK1625740.1 acetoin utilization protein [Afifella marina]MBK5917563.1 acetoin utilization protein [Afifella marina]RAI23730.1 acetoin utilization protein [Afifella marina DSM 2698]SCZ21910.1 Acetoin utilization deacetylase AcuC [Afifella marina DSM 2698]
MTTLLLHHADFLDHLTAPGHPERPDRLKALHAALDHEAFAALRREEAPLGDKDVAALAHPQEYVERVHRAIPEVGLASIDADTVVSPGSWNACLRGIGAISRAVDAVVAREVNNAFAAIRPPGHHAETDTAMGFCVFNNAAVTARYAQKQHGLERVAIVDWDVHHGNGTQDIFWSDASVLYASTHQMPLYPGTGARSETGVGNIVNAPLAAGDGSDHFREAFNERILPSVKNFAPDLIIISAGFDAHHRDPLAELNLEHEDFAWATGKLMDLADDHAGGRLVSVLEGGYDLRGLAVSAAAHIRMLMSA